MTRWYTTDREVLYVDDRNDVHQLFPRLGRLPALPDGAEETPADRIGDDLLAAARHLERAHITPGPWVAGSSVFGEGLHLFSPAAGRSVAWVAPANVADAEDPADHADVRLLLAAPELVALVRELAQALRAHVADEARRLSVPPAELCPCTVDVLARAAAVLSTLAPDREAP